MLEFLLAVTILGVCGHVLALYIAFTNDITDYFDQWAIDFINNNWRLWALVQAIMENLNGEEKCLGQMNPNNKQQCSKKTYLQAFGMVPRQTTNGLLPFQKDKTLESTQDDSTFYTTFLGGKTHYFDYCIRATVPAH